MRNRQLFLATMAFALAFAVWGLIAALGPRFKDLYHLSQTQTAVAVAVPVILGALFRIPLGILADRFGGRLVFSLLLAFAIVPAAGIALVHSYAALLVGGFFLGVVGAGFAVGVSFCARWFPPERQGRRPGRRSSGSSAPSVLSGR